EADLQTYRPDLTLVSVHAFLVRGSGRVDDIAMSGGTPAVDTEAPVVTLVGDANMTIIVGEIYTVWAIVTDNVDTNLTAVASGDVVDTNVIGVYTVIYTATDSAGNVGTATQTVNVIAAPVVDTEAPVVTLNGDVNISITVGGTYTELNATVTDNVDNNLTAVITGDVNISTVGVYTVTYTATDTAGNVGTATRTVNVVAGATGTIYEDAEDGTTNRWTIYDNNPAGATVTNEVYGSNRVIRYEGLGINNGYMLGNFEGQAGDWNNTRDHNISWTMRTSENYKIYIRVTTNTGPLYLFYTGDATDRGNDPSEGVGTYIHHGLGAETQDGDWHTTTRNLQADLQEFLPGTQLLAVHAFLIRGSGEIDDIMMDDDSATPIVDIIPPIVILNGDANVSVTVGGTYTELNATVTDNVDTNLTAVITGTVNTSTIGTYVLTYTATDSAGNEGNATRTVNVIAPIVDTIAPEITVLGELHVSLDINESYTDAGATAIDNIDGNITNNIITILYFIPEGALDYYLVNEIDTSLVGVYVVIYGVADAAGNTTEEIRAVEITRPDITPPVVILNGDANVSVVVGGTYTELNATVTDNVDTNLTAVITGTVNTSTIGTYLLTYTATDSAGNEGNATRTVNVISFPIVDTEAPVVTLNGDANVSVVVGGTYTELNATVTDNVDSNLTAVITGDVNTSTIGVYTVTYTATDSAGNEGNATRTVNVVAADVNATVTGRVVSTTGSVIPSVTVNVFPENNATALGLNISSDVNGLFTLSLSNDQNFTLQFIADGYATQVLPIHTPAVNQSINLDIVMIARGVQQSVSETDSSIISGDDGARVTVDAGVFMDQGGAVVTDNIQVTITPVDVSTPLGVATFPGNFSGIQEGATEATPIVSYGTVEYQFTRNGEILQLVPGETAEIEIPIYVTTHQDGTAIAVGDIIPLWSLDESSGIWSQDGTGVVVSSATSPTGFALRATVDHFTWWNCDVSMTTARAIVSVTAPETGTAVVKARTDANNIAWGPDTVSTIIPVGTSTNPLYIPSNVEVCFWAEITFESGAIATTIEECVTAVENSTVNVDLVISSEPLALAVTPTSTVYTGINRASKQLTILPTSLESSVTYSVIFGSLPSGVTLKTLGDTKAYISGVPTQIGTYNAIIQGVDSDGTVAAVPVNYIVTDTTAPVITLLGNPYVMVDISEPYTDAGATALDDVDGDITADIVKTITYYPSDGSGSSATVPDVNTALAGTYRIDYDVSDNTGNTANQVSRYVDVMSNQCQEPPMLMLNGDDNVSIIIGETYVEDGATAYNCMEEMITVDINASELDTSTVGVYTIIYRAEDSGLVEEVYRTVNVLPIPDMEAPVITLIGSANITINQGGSYVELNATAMDNEDGNITDRIVIDSSMVNTYVPGDYNVTYNVEDLAGNNAIEVIREVHVVVVPDDITPDAFTFTDLTDVNLLEFQQANMVVSGINVPTFISIVNGAYSLDNGITWIDTPAFVTDGTTVLVRHMSSYEYNTSVDTNLTIGGVTDTFSSRTKPFAPEAPIAMINYQENIVNSQVYAGEILFAEAGGISNLAPIGGGIEYCKWEDDVGVIVIEETINPVQSFLYGACLLDSVSFSTAGNYMYTLTVRDTNGVTDTNELNITVLENAIPTVDIGDDRNITVGTTLNITAGAVDGDGGDMTYQWMYGLKNSGTMYGAGSTLNFSHLFNTVGIYVVEFTAIDSHNAMVTEQIEVNVTAEAPRTAALSLVNESLTPAPLFPLEDNGEGVVTFGLVETENSMVPSDYNSRITVELSKLGLKDDNVALITGDILNYFSVTYTATTHQVIFTQTQDFPGFENVTVSIPVSVTENSVSTDIELNGFHASISIDGGEEESILEQYTYTQDTMSDQIVQRHNVYRNLDFDDSNLTWDAELAIHAQAWADYLAANYTEENRTSGVSPHASQFNSGSHGLSYIGEGENIAWGNPNMPYITPAPVDLMVANSGDGGAVDAWANEKANYDYATNSSTGGEIGHYTQVVWQKTTKVGCGKATSTTNNGGEHVVCRYAVAGNLNNDKPYCSNYTTSNFYTDDTLVFTSAMIENKSFNIVKVLEDREVCTQIENPDGTLMIMDVMGASFALIDPSFDAFNQGDGSNQWSMSFDIVVIDSKGQLILTNTSNDRYMKLKLIGEDASYFFVEADWMVENNPLYARSAILKLEK
ncbi:MAG: DUF5011 domain-containing protein, partial [Epsilonproteobacteria bacterium]|nr:DUF5011 domain-containing protein [Campylobacterota bacterium]